MKVKELFARLDKDDILRAYRFIYGVFEDYELAGYTIPELIKFDKNFDKKAGKLIDEIINVKETPSSDRDMVIFVIRVPSDNVEDPGEKNFESMIVFEKEFREKAGKDFQMLTTKDGGKAFLSSYCYDTETLETIGNYRIADQSIEECSAVVCAAEIFMNVRFFGFDDKTRQKNIKEELDIIQERLDNINKGKEKCVPMDIAFAKMEKRHNDILIVEDDDSRQYWKLKNKFDREFKENVRDIEQRLLSKFFESKHQKQIDHIKAEWNRVYGNRL